MGRPTGGGRLILAARGQGYLGRSVGGSMPRFPPSPKLTVDAVWVDRGDVLLVRRGRPPFRGALALPGGFVKAGESVARAVRRELREETGLVAHVVGLVGVYSTPGRDPRGPTVTLAFRLRGARRTPRAGDDAAAAEWVPLARARQLAFDHNRILRDALTKQRSIWT